VTSSVDQVVTVSLPDPDQTAFVTVTVGGIDTQLKSLSVYSSHTSETTVTSTTTVLSIYRTDFYTSVHPASVITVPSSIVTETDFTSTHHPTHLINASVTVTPLVLDITVSTMPLFDTVNNLATVLSTAFVLNPISVITATIDVTDPILTVGTITNLLDLDVTLTIVTQVIASLTDIFPL